MGWKKKRSVLHARYRMRLDRPRGGRVTRTVHVFNMHLGLSGAERKIQLQTLRLQPKREYVRERREWVEVGYEAIRQVVVELDELEKLPELVTRVVQEGANRLSGLEYGLQDEETARNRALREAVLNARGKAALLAETLGQSLGRPLTISEESFSFPQPVARFDQAMMAKAEQAEAEPAAYAAGEITVTARVQVTFELSDE